LYANRTYALYKVPPGQPREGIAEEN
jgi:hypothetical protein